MVIEEVYMYLELLTEMKMCVRMCRFDVFIIHHGSKHYLLRALAVHASLHSMVTHLLGSLTSSIERSLGHVLQMRVITEVLTYVVVET